MECVAEEQQGEAKKRTFMFTVQQIVNRLRRGKTCFCSCAAAEKKRERKRSCFVTIRNRYKNRSGGVNESI